MVSSTYHSAIGQRRAVSPKSSSRLTVRKWSVDGILDKAKKLLFGWSLKSLLPGIDDKSNAARGNAVVKGNTPEPKPTAPILKRTAYSHYLSEVTQSKKLKRPVTKAAAQKRLKKLEARNTKENAKAGLHNVQTPLHAQRVPGGGSRKKVSFGSNQIRPISPLSTATKALVRGNKENEVEEGESLNFDSDAISEEEEVVVVERIGKAQKVDTGRSPLRGTKAKFAMFVVPT